jgi:hypothetical protein
MMRARKAWVAVPVLTGLLAVSGEVLHAPGAKNLGDDPKTRCFYLRRSPDLHSAIDDDIDAGHVRTVIEQSDVRHF